MKAPKLLILALCCGLSIARAQDLKNVPPPTAPLVAALPETGAWTITLVPLEGVEPAEDPSKPSKPKLMSISKVRTVKTGKIKLDEMTIAEGKIYQNWFVGGGIFLVQYPNGKVGAAQVDPQADRTGVSVAGIYAGSSWVTLANFHGVVLYEKRPAYLYQFQSEDTPFLQTWIDAETKLPLAFSMGSQHYRYSFEIEKPEPLQLPPALAKAQLEMQDEIALSSEAPTGNKIGHAIELMPTTRSKPENRRSSNFLL